MHVAIAVGAILLGGWVLEPPTDDQQAATSTVQTPSTTTPALPPASILWNRRDLRTTVSSERDRNGVNGQTPNGQQPRGQGSAGQLPFLPTEPLPPDVEGTQGQPTAPTAPSPTTGRGGAGGLSTATGPLYGPLAPTAPLDRSRSPWSPGYRATSSGANQLNSRAQALGGMSIVAPSPPQKAFSGYQASSGVSPYMNLFRNDTSGGTVDNYTTLVRPQLNQQFLNQQFNHEIGGLNRSAIMQQSMLQQMNTGGANAGPTGISTPQFYMNSGGYYPGGQ